MDKAEIPGEGNGNARKDNRCSLHFSFIRGLQGWGEQTTLHGLPAVFSPKSSLLRRFFWICIIIGSLFALQLGYRMQIGRYLEYRAVTKDTIRHVDYITFPAVTICSNCLLRNSSFRDEKEHQLVVDIQSGANVSDLIARYGTEYLKRVNIDELYHRHAQPYDEMVSLCKWTRQNLGCSKWVRERKIQYNHCYTFNGGEGQQEIGKLSSLGSDNGLYMILFANQDNYVLSVNNNAGFRIVVHDQDEEPDMRRSTFLSPGFSYYLGLSKYEIKLMPQVVKTLGGESCLEMKKGGHDGRDRLKHFHKYSYSACETDCMIGFVQNECGCSHILHGGPGRECNLFEAVSCAYKAEAQFYRESAQHMKICGCFLLCDYTVYDTKLSFAYFPNQNFVQKAKKRFKMKSVDMEYIRANYLSVNIFYETKVVTTKEQILEFPKWDLIASLAGYLGLAVGASALTGVEFVELMFLLLFKLIRRK